MTPIEQQVLDTIRNSNTPVHSRAIAQIAEIDRVDVSRVLPALRNEGLIEKAGEEKLPGKGGRHVAVYRAIDIDSQLAELMHASKAQDDEPAPTETRADTDHQYPPFPYLTKQQYESEGQAIKDAESACLAVAPIDRAIEQIRFVKPIHNGRARVARLRTLAHQAQSASVDIAEFLMETADIIEEISE